jgi:aldose 1-epimerase
MKHYLIAVIFGLALISCNLKETGSSKASAPMPDTSAFDKMIDGVPVKLYQLKNHNGMSVAITNYGGRVVSLIVPDQLDKPVDVVLGYNTLDGYLQSHELYYGALIGRYANRIARGTFSLDGKSYSLARNNGVNHLHGGPTGFHNRPWKVVSMSDTSLNLRYDSKDGEEGYPGNLEVNVNYNLGNDNGLRITYSAVSDKPTPVNLTNHSFFNLNGEGSGSVNDHLLEIHASHYTPVDSTLIPDGRISEVAHTPFDFQQPHAIGQKLASADAQLQYGGGYDHNFILDKRTGDKGPQLAARATGDKSGIVLEVFTTEPALQFYGGNFLKGLDTGKAGRAYAYRNAFCLEAQHSPDSPNQTGFPATIIRPGSPYEQVTIYRFSVAPK